MAHFYVVAQYVSPVLAWGFLGTDAELKQVCEYFKVQYLKATTTTTTTKTTTAKSSLLDRSSTGRSLLQGLVSLENYQQTSNYL